MKKKLIFFLALCFLLINCNEKVKHFQLEKSQNITLCAPDSFYIPLGSLKYVEFQNKKYIISYDHVNLNLNYFDGEKYNFLSRYRPETSFTAPTNISYYLPYTKDSIFYCDSENNIFYQFDSLGKCTNSWNIFKNKPDSEQKFIVMSKRYYELTYDNKTICSRIYPIEGSPGEFSKPLECSFIKNDTDFLIINMPIRYPETYRQGKNYNSLSVEYVSKCINNKLSIYSFPVDHNLFVYSKDRFINSYLCKSKYIDQFEETPLEKANDLQYTIQTYCTAPYYSKIYYDKYRNLYYRIAMHAIPRHKSDGTLNFGWRDKPWSIIVLNTDFKILDEIYFKAAQYIPDLLILPQGLLFQRLRSEKDSEKYSNFELNKIINYEE